MDYTPEQLAAIQDINTNLQIIACAGSGKTQVISERIVNILRSGALPENIVAFTFTDKAATELKDRIHRLCREELGSDTGLGDMYIGTIHGFCLNILQEPPVYRYLKYQVLSDVHQRLLIDRHSNQSGLTNTPLLNGGNLRRWVDSRLFQQLISILSEAEVDNTQIPQQVLDSINMYHELADNHRYLDYTSILREAYDSLNNDDNLRNTLSDRLRYLIVDEYQDVNPLQENIINTIYELCGNICVVGDDDQTIYQWRGSDVNNIIQFTNRYPNVRTISLNQNFRSSHAIVECTKRFIERVTDRLPKTMESANSQPTIRGDILAIGFDSVEDEANWLVQKIQWLHGSEYRDHVDDEPRGLVYSDISILLRSVRRDARAIVEALDRENIPYIVGGMDGLFDPPEIQVIVNIFNYLSDFSPRGTNPPTIEDIRLSLENSGFGLDEDNINEGIEYLAQRKERINENSMDAELYLQNLYLNFLAAISLREESIDRDEANNRTGEIIYFNLGKFSNVISDFEQINFHSNPIDLYPAFASSLYHQASDYYPEGWEENAIGRPDAVQIMTVHAAKGMQWPAVFIPCLRQNRFPSRRQGGRSVWHVIPITSVTNSDRFRGTLEDERRLFYVAATRAEKYLFFTWAPIPTNNQQRSRSQFHRDVTNYEHILTADPNTPPPPPTEPRARVENITLPLTFSELKYYFECPYLFKLRFLYGFDTPINRALGYGKSLHDALAEIHSESINGNIPTIEDVPRLVEDHLHLPYANTMVRENLIAAANNALTNYLTEHGANLENLEHVEKVIELKLEEGVVVNGRIDLIRRNDTEETIIVDFKSRDEAQAETITQKQLHIYAVGYEQLTGTRANLIEIHNLDQGGARREIINDQLTNETMTQISEAGRNLRTNNLPRLNNWCRTCETCDLRSICRSQNQ